MPEAAFRAEVDRYSRTIRETYAPMPGFDRALLPGAVEEETMALYRREGIHFGEPEQGTARKLNESMGVPLPWD